VVSAESSTFRREVVAEVAAMWAAAEPRCGSVNVLAIDGPAGAGKTTLAADLAAISGAATVHLDDLYAGWTGLGAGIALVRRTVLAPLSRGHAIAVPTYDWARNEYTSLTPLNVGRLLIVEGVGAGALELEDLVSVLVYLDAAPTTRRAQALGRGGEGFEDRWDEWAAVEARYWESDRPRERAQYYYDAAAND
jgi:uridine kinase